MPTIHQAWGMKRVNETDQVRCHGTYFPKRKWTADNETIVISLDRTCHVENKTGSCVRVTPEKVSFRLRPEGEALV